MGHFYGHLSIGSLQIVTVVQGIVLSGILAIITKLIYNIYLHPLSKFPGSTLWAASPLPLARAQLRGQWHEFIKSAHDQYGNIVRVSPNELSFISGPAWNDIYARRQGHHPLARDPTFFNDMLVDKETMTMADHATHARIRRSLAPAFAPRALMEQEPIITKNVDLLLSQLEDRASQGSSPDLRAWYNYITFDLIGDLAFGESFGCLQNSTFHEWVQFVLDYFFAATLLNVVHRFRPLNRVLASLLPQSLLEKQKKHSEMAMAKVRQRIQADTNRPDFVYHMIKAADADTISKEQLEKQASILILAGSETTSVALTFATFHLIQHKGKLTKLRSELAAAYTKESDIDILSVNQLPYLHAVIQETLRLYPPITNGFPRITPSEGAVVAGHVIPGQTTVNINHWAAYRSEQNFKRPNQFLPERWLADPEYENDSKDVFQPFSVGPRNCIGKKFAYDTMKLVLARMMWRFDMRLHPDSRSWDRHQSTYVSWHQPPLMVDITLARGNSQERTACVEKAH